MPSMRAPRPRGREGRWAESQRPPAEVGLAGEHLQREQDLRRQYQLENTPLKTCKHPKKTQKADRDRQHIPAHDD